MKSDLFSCPVPIQDYPRVVMAHGGGGRLSHQLITQMFQPLFSNPELDTAHDSALLTVKGRLAFTTDSHVIQPLFYPGGDIGSLAVYGTVNDLAMSGALPRYLSLGFIIEEGLEMQTLWKVVQRIQDACERTGVNIVTGDTKVIDRRDGESAELYINTSGIGIIEHDLDIRPACIKPGDHILVSGDLGRHGIAVLAHREGLLFESHITSDCAPLHDLVRTVIDAGINVHCLRDLTRGGLVSALVELSRTSNYGMIVNEEDIPVSSEVQAACELLGFDPFFVANEGRCVVFVPAEQSEKTLAVLQKHPLGRGAALIGEVTDVESGGVTARNTYGGSRILDMFSGEQLPRIC